MRADRLHGKAMRQRDVVADLIHLGHRQLQAGRVDPRSIAEIHEPSGFIDREEGFDAITQALRYVPRIGAERL